MLRRYNLAFLLAVLIAIFVAGSRRERFVPSKIFEYVLVFVIRRRPGEKSGVVPRNGLEGVRKSRFLKEIHNAGNILRDGKKVYGRFDHSCATVWPVGARP